MVLEILKSPIELNDTEVFFSIIPSPLVFGDVCFPGVSWKTIGISYISLLLVDAFVVQRYIFCQKARRVFVVT